MADDSTTQEFMDVRYTGNSDPRNGNERITLDGRPDINVGGIGQITVKEFNVLSGRGLLFDVLTKQELSAPATHSHGDLAHDHPLDFKSVPATELEKLADEHDLDVTGTGAGGNIVKKDLEDALAAAHA